ncbi:DUF6192 family protein [Streptomyces sp. NPDC058297]|uniref:DUF6192 family protein n=1 Tax=unclassified Streptomyces TaxID=2593676 RepID=UPI0036E84D61
MALSTTARRRQSSDDTARHAVNRAQTDCSRQQADAFRRETSVGRTVRPSTPPCTTPSAPRSSI